MGDLSKNFSRSEFACKCGCGQAIINEELVDVLQRLRDYVELPIRITSANRCEKHNANVGGVKDSKHIIGQAADIQVDGLEPETLYRVLDQWYPSTYGLGVYNTFTHIDVRKSKARWDKRG